MQDIMSFLDSIRVLIIMGILAVSLYYLVIIGNRYVGDERAIDIRKKTLVKTGFVLFGIIFFYRQFWGNEFFSTVVFTIAISAVLAYFLNPLVVRLEKRKIKRGFGVVILYASVVLFFFITFKTIGPKIGEEVKSLVDNMPRYANKTYDFFRGIYDQYSIQSENLPIDIASLEEGVSDAIDSFKSSIGESLISMANAVVSFFSKVINVILVPILTFYFLKDKDLFKDKISKLVPDKYEKDLFKLFRDIDKELGKYIRGQLLVCLFIGTATTIALLIIGVEFAIIIGIFAGVFSIIPYLGAVIGFFPAVLFAALDDPIKIIWVAIAIAIIQMLEGNLVSPKILGSSVGVHPTVVMISVLVGGGYFGLIGMLLAVPVVSSSRVIYRFIRDKIASMSDETLLEK